MRGLTLSRGVYNGSSPHQRSVRFLTPFKHSAQDFSEKQLINNCRSLKITTSITRGKAEQLKDPFRWFLFRRSVNEERMLRYRPYRMIT